MAGVAGRSGPRSKTTQEHQRNGTYRADRHGFGVSPDPPKGTPEPPKALDGDAREEWDRMVGRMDLSRTLSKVDDAVLYQYCQLFAETEQLAVTKEETAASIDVLEENIRGLKGEQLVACFQEITKLRKIEAGYSSQIRQGRMGLRTYLIEFGMTPAARGKVKVSTADAPKSKWDGLVN